METCFNYCDSKEAFFSSDERKWIVKVRKLAETYPDEVQIIKQPEDNDGCIYCKLPSSYLKFKTKRPMSDKQKQEATERLVVARAKKHNS